VIRTLGEGNVLGSGLEQACSEAIDAEAGRFLTGPRRQGAEEAGRTFVTRKAGYWTQNGASVCNRGGGRREKVEDDLCGTSPKFKILAGL